MKKKAGARASKAAKGRKSGAAGRKAAAQRAQAGSRRSAATKKVGSGETKSTVRRLRQELAKARAEIERLKAAGVIATGPGSPEPARQPSKQALDG